MARPKKSGNRELPPNLYRNGKYFRYRRPDTGKFFNIGTDRAKAIADANYLNAKLLQPGNAVAVVLSESVTMGDLLDRYKSEAVPEKNLAERTEKEMGYRLEQIRTQFGKVPVESVTVRMLADWLDGHSACAHQQMRSTLVDLFRFAIAKGLVDANPADATLRKKRPKKSRQRMTKEQFSAVREVAPDWLKVAMDIALVTGQRPGDVVNLKYSDIRDGRLFMVQAKTEKHGDCARLSFRMTDSLERAVSLSRADGVVSPYIVHRQPARVPSRSKQAQMTTKGHWTQVTRKYLSDTFGELRDGLKVFEEIPAAERPGFGEIRALAGHLYETELGWKPEQVQRLLGHTTVGMTQHYLDGHGERWTEVEPELKVGK